MKATKEQRRLLDKTYYGLMDELHKELNLFRAKLVNGTLIDCDVIYEHEYEQFGRAAFFHKVESFMAGEKLIDETKKLTNDKYQ